jgi:hypothetical protein
MAPTAIRHAGMPALLGPTASMTLRHTRLTPLLRRFPMLWARKMAAGGGLAAPSSLRPVLAVTTSSASPRTAKTSLSVFPHPIPPRPGSD